ncbi:MAG: hypothetical protein IT467_08525 [Dokdonella sp.]|uniref:hypothetical protein n=1 Tax=Dokdonella sp. TaxID=2291710 RepID=UPI0025C21F9F|nr:hypothetical protein [Dokdonella sp.]MBZ0221861.1 hypothetical protein [Dokdonella sp.]MCC7255960.1 hypothetical protein [Dokdonella sp.]
MSETTPGRRTDIRDETMSPLRKLGLIAAAILVGGLVYVTLDYAFSQFALARFPAPEQAAVWSTIGHFVAAIIALAAALQPLRRWWWPR